MATARPRHLAVDDVWVWHAVRAIVVVLATTEAVFSAWVWRTPLDVLLAVVSAAAVIVALFHPVPGVLMALAPLISDILMPRDHGVTPMVVVTIVVAARAQPRVALLVLTGVAGIRAGHLWWSSGSTESLFLAALFLAALGVGVVLRWLLRHRILSTRELSLLEERVRATRQEERAALADELSGILTQDLRATGALLDRAQVAGAGAASLVEVDARARASLTRLRRLVSTLRGAGTADQATPGDLVSALEEVEDHLVGHGLTVEIDLPDPATIRPTTDADALLRTLRTAVDRLREEGGTGTIHLRVAASGGGVAVLVGRRDGDLGTRWLVEEFVPPRPQSAAPADAPRRPFLTRISLNTARLALALPATAAAGVWTVGLVLTWRERPELLTHDLAMVVAFLALALAATSPPASAMVLAAAAILTSTRLAPVPGLSPLFFLNVFLLAVVAANWPRIVPVVALGSALTFIWWHRGSDDHLVMSLASVMLLTFGVAFGLGVRYFVRVRAAHLQEFTRLTRAFSVARTTERAQLAGELHDIVAHQLSLMTMVLMAHGTSDEPAAVTATRLRLVRLNAAAQADLATLVNLTRQDAPPSREPGTTPSRAAAATAETLRAAGHPIDLRVSAGADSSDPTTQRTVSSILREATTNILRYAPTGSPVEMVITASEATLGVRVVSALPSMARTNADSTGFGLIGLAERVTLTGGTFTAGPVGDHWVVAASVPRTPDSDPIAPRPSRLFTRRSAAVGSD